RRPEDVHPRLLESACQPERGLAAELDHDAERALELDDFENVLQRQRLEVEHVADIEIGGDRLGVRVHHYGAITHLTERERGPYTAVIELDPLPDPVGTTAVNDDRFTPVAPGSLVLLVVARIQV